MGECKYCSSHPALTPMLAFYYCPHIHQSKQTQNTVNCVFESQDAEFNLSESKTPSTNDSDCALCHLGAEREHMLNHSESQASPTLF